MKITAKSLLFLTASALLLVFNPGAARADQIINRSVSLSDYDASAISSYGFSFTIPTTSNIGSISFLYCSNTPSYNDSCTAAAGVDVTSASLSSQTGNTGFSFDGVDTTANKIVINRTASAGLAVASTYTFTNITNPSTAGATTYIRIATFPTTDGSGTQQDTGSVVFLTNPSPPFNIDAYVPPYIRICVGITVAPDCSSVSGDFIDLGDLSSTSANYAQSQYSVGGNSPTGYIVYALGTTMTSGNNTIPSLSLPTASFPGTSQFGINLRANLIPAIGQDPVGVGTGTPEPNYNTPNQYLYVPGDSISSATISSDYNRMTVSYIVNVDSTQPAGVYATTVTYLAVGQF